MGVWMFQCVIGIFISFLSKKHSAAHVWKEDILLNARGSHVFWGLAKEMTHKTFIKKDEKKQQSSLVQCKQGRLQMIDYKEKYTWRSVSVIFPAIYIPTHG